MLMEKTGRNNKCKCGSNVKYKTCCLRSDEKEKQISVFSEFSAVPDPRDTRGKRYKLIDLLIMVIYGILNGYDDFENLADFLKQNRLYFKNLLLIEKTPSHDCLSDLFAMINPKQFMEIFIKWITSIVELKTGTIISIDGKAVKSARDKINGGNTPYILSAFLSEIGLSIGQVAVDKKSNEIKAIPDLLKLLDIKDCYITIDAMGTQEAIARNIVKSKGHYVLKVKKNQKILMNDISTYFNETTLESKDIDYIETEAKKNHGREEYREYYVSHCCDCITDKNKWETVSAIGKVVVHKWIKDKSEVTEHFYIMDTKMNIEMFVRATRGHWNIECGLHWRLDVILNEDRSRNRVGDSISNLSAIRKLVFNIVKLDASFGKISFEKKLTRYRYNFENIENLIFNVIPSIKSG
jgi:predicted transposase YbfD/YdcC